MKKCLLLTIALLNLLVISSLFLQASPVDALSCAPTFHKIGTVKTIDEETVTLEQTYAYGFDQDLGDPFSSTLYGSPAVFRIDLYEKIVNAYLTLSPQSSKPIVVPSDERIITFTPIEDTEDWSKEKVYIRQIRNRKVSWGVGDIMVVGGTMCSCDYSLKGVFTSQGEMKVIVLDTPLTTYSYRGTSITPTAVNYDLDKVKFRIGDEEFSLKSGESFSPKNKYVESITLNSIQGGCWGEESVSFDLVLEDGGSEIPTPSPSPRTPPPLPPRPNSNSVLILTFMLLIGVAGAGIFAIFFRKGRDTNFLKDFRTEIRIALIGIGILIVGGAISLFIAVYFSQKVSYQIGEIPPELGVSEQASEARECRELIAGHNDLEDNRIDFVLIGFDYTSLGKFLEVSQTAIDFPGSNGGLFSLEPFKSNKDKFNIWYVTTLGDTKNQARDNWELSSICREKLGLSNPSLLEKSISLAIRCLPCS